MKREKLNELQARMKAFGAMAEQLAMSVEILKARVTVHDEMGHLLLSGKYYLDSERSADEEKLLQMQRYTHQLLMSEGEEPNQGNQDSVHNAVVFASGMGVTVNISGELPQNKEFTKIIGPVSWAVFDDTGYVTVEDQKKYVLAGYSDYEFEPITIGNNSYEILTAGTNGDVSFLVAPRSDDFSVLIELRNVTVEEATPMLETVVID